MDPITRELVKNALATITDNMMVTVARTARSNNVKLALDFSTAICDVDGQMVAQGLSVPLHLGAIMPALEGILRYYREDIRPGDIFANNDPYEGGSHLPDIFLFKPIFSDERLLAFLAIIAHNIDIGGRVAGGNACDSTEIYQEGLRIPPLKLFEEGRPNQTLFRMIRQNVRVPDKVMGDLWAQISALYMGEKELLKLAQEYGVEEFLGYMADLLEYTERLARAEIAALPQGECELVDYVDDDGFSDEPIRIQTKVIIQGDEITVDFTGTSPQCRGAINCNLPTTMSCVYAAVRSILSQEVPNNAGYFRPIKVVAPAGSYVNCSHPAPVAARGLGTHRLRQSILGALAPLLPDKIPACWGGGSSGISIAGYHKDGSAFIFVDFHNITGTGGGPDRDGVDGGQHPLMNTANNPAELIEAEQPLLVEEYGFLPDTGGAGKYRGSLSVVRQFRIMAEEATVQIRTDRRRFPAYGLHGGKPGSLCFVYLNPQKENQLLPAKCLLQLKKGEVVRVEMGGAGGYGNPLERDPEAVARDVREGKVTPEHARREYGREVEVPQPV